MFTVIETCSVLVHRSKTSRMGRARVSRVDLRRRAETVFAIRRVWLKTRTREICDRADAFANTRDARVLPFWREFGSSHHPRRNKPESWAGCFFRGGGSCFVILGVAVNLPEIVKLRVRENVFDA